MADPKSHQVTFNLVGDNYPHAWFFNRFRIDQLGDSYLVTLSLTTQNGGNPAVNGFVLGKPDLSNNRPRIEQYLKNVGEVNDEGGHELTFASPPSRVYPVNHINLARVGDSAEIGLYRFSINSLVERLPSTKAKALSKGEPIQCYPVVMFRSDLPIQIALLKELLSRA